MKFRIAGIIAAVAVISLALSGCSDTERARTMSLNKYSTFHVVQRSYDGKEESWDTTSRPESEDNSDGFTFVDAKTHKLQIISGGIINITEN